MISAIIAPIILIMFLIMFTLSMCQGNVDDPISGSYDEEAFQDYADDQYALHFSDSPAYEDNLLIVVLTEENNSDFYYIAWVGDHIATPINHLMGNNSTTLGRAMNSCINQSNYKYSLDSNLADVMNTMTRAVTDLGLESSFTCSESRSIMTADLVNYTNLPMTESTVEDALEQFTDATGIPVVIVVEDASDVFISQTSSGGNGFSLSGGTIVALIVIVVLVVVIIIQQKGKKETGNDRYRNFDK